MGVFSHLEARAAPSLTVMPPEPRTPEEAEFLNTASRSSEMYRQGGHEDPKLLSFLSLPRIPTFKKCPESIHISRLPQRPSQASSRVSPRTPTTASLWPPCLLLAPSVSPPTPVGPILYNKKNQGVSPLCCQLSSAFP